MGELVCKDLDHDIPRIHQHSIVYNTTAAVAQAAPLPSTPSRIQPSLQPRFAYLLTGSLPVGRDEPRVLHTLSSSRPLRLAEAVVSASAADVDDASVADPDPEPP